MSPEVDLVRKKMARGVHVHRVVKNESSNHLVSPPPFCSLPEEMHEWGLSLPHGSGLSLRLATTDEKKKK